MNAPTPFRSWDGRERFFQQVREARRCLLMLDYDGTLAPFHTQRDQARPYPGAMERLQQLIARPSVRVVIISGRAIADLRPLLDISPLPELWGTHGWERLSGAGIAAPVVLPAHAQSVLDAEASALQGAGLAEHVERKPAAVAVHWRGASPARRAHLSAAVQPRWAQIAPQSGLEVHAFDGGIELRAVGRTKGWAVKALLQEYQPDVAAFLGDDATDEQAFDALKGCGLCVQVRKELRTPTSADIWLTPPADLLAFLDALLAAAERPVA